MRDYDPTTGRYLQEDPLGLVDGASVYGYALQNPGRYVDPRGEAIVNPWTAAMAGAAIGAALAAYGEYLDHGFMFECWNPWRILGYGFGGAGIGAAAPALLGAGAGALGYGGFPVNGMLHSSRAGLSTYFPNISKQISRATGNAGQGLSNHHWLIPQKFFPANPPRWLEGALNSRLLMNRIDGRLNSYIGANTLKPNMQGLTNIFGGGAPSWVPINLLTLPGSAGFSSLGHDNGACGCGG